MKRIKIINFKVSEPEFEEIKEISEYNSLSVSAFVRTNLVKLIRTKKLVDKQ